MMKTKIKVKSLIDKNTKVPVNSPTHRIEEIKREISECFTTNEFSTCKTEVLEMWEKE